MKDQRAWHAFGVALGVLAVAGCSGPGAEASLDVEIDHRSVSKPPEPLANNGPPPGRFEQLWETTLDDEPLGYHLLGSHVVVATETGVQAYDARTGEPSWRYHEPGRELWRIAASNDAIVLETHGQVLDVDSAPTTADHLVGLDAATGELLWERGGDWSLLSDGISGSRTLHELGDAAGGVVVVETDHRERAGVDARTGDERWRFEEAAEIADECTAETTEGGNDGRAVVLTTVPCGSPLSRMAVVLDAESGELYWRRPADELGGTWTVMQAGVALLGGRDSPPVLISPTGEELYTGETGSSCSCDLYAAGDRVVLSYATSDDRAWISVDPASGTVTRMQEWADAWTRHPQTTTEGAAYGFGSVAQWDLLPWMVAIADVTTGDTTTVPLPMPAVDTRQPNWLGARGDQLFVARAPVDANSSAPGAATITAYRSMPTDGPAELGGVSPDEWPDPCLLLDGAPEGDDDRQRGILERGEPFQVGSVTIPRKWCRVRLVDHDTAAVGVQWVAATEEEAAAIADTTHLDPAIAQPTVPGADSAWTTINDGTFLQVGKTIVTVSTTAPHRTRDAVLRTVVENLQPG